MHLLLNDETRHMLDADGLALLPASAYVINVVRGAVVDEAGLTDAHVSGRLVGAGLDLQGEPPWLSTSLCDLPNDILTPRRVPAAPTALSATCCTRRRKDATGWPRGEVLLH